jgi:hypothetical protein
MGLAGGNLRMVAGEPEHGSFLGCPEYVESILTLLRNPQALFPFGLSLEGWKMAGYGALPTTELCTDFVVSVAALLPFSSPPHSYYFVYPSSFNFLASEATLSAMCAIAD